MVEVSFLKQPNFVLAPQKIGYVQVLMPYSS